MDVSDNWRKEIPIKFPVYQHHPPYDFGNGTIRTLLLNSTNAPVLTFPVFLGLRQYESGLSRNTDFPSKSDLVPGGVFDAGGVYIPIVDVDAPMNPPTGIKSLVLGTYSIFIATFQHRLCFGEPIQLDLEDYKSRLIKLMHQQKRLPRPTAQLKKAKSFYDVMSVECGEKVMEKYYKTEVVKNWIDEPKRF